MDNHVHHIAVPEHEDSLAKTIKEAHGEYSRYFNTKYGLMGHAWQNRFKSFPMDWDHCQTAIRYVELNPVRAGMVSRAQDYLWSSAAAHCGLRNDPLLSGACPFLSEIRDWSEWLKLPEDESVGDAIRNHTQTGRPLGPKEFVLQLERQVNRDLRPQKRGRKRKLGN